MTKAQVIALIDQYITTNGNEEITGAQTNSVMKALANQDMPFADIINKPTTLSGYGITDGVPTSRTISSGLHLSGGGNLSANRTLTLTPTVNQWIVDSEGNQRIFLGGSISANGFLFQASTTGQEFQYRNSAGTKQFWVTDTGSINGSNIVTSGSGNFGTIATITGSAPSVRFTETGSSFDWRIITSSDNISIRKQGTSGTSLIMRSDNTNEFFGTLAATGGNSTQWNTAYGWGNHASAGYALQSTQINTGNHLSGGGNLSANRTLTLTPTVNNWIVDSQGNQRMYFNSSSGISSGILFKASAANQEIQYRDLNSNIVFRVNDSGNVTASSFSGSIDASNIDSGKLADTRLQVSNVTQFNNAINPEQVNGIRLWDGTQAEYDAISNKRNDTLYFITQ